MKIVDLFCGCGGFSLGGQNAGFDIALSVDVDPVLTSSYRKNFPNSNLTLADAATLSGATCAELARTEIDGVIGGPPCQGFSSIGKRDQDDPRRALLGHFFRLVTEIQPKFFVMENVKGILQGHSSDLLQEELAQIRTEYDLLGPVVLDAAEFGAATKRPRVFVLGFRQDVGVSTAGALEALEKQRAPAATVRDAISDLIGATLVNRPNDGFDLWRSDRRRKLSSYASRLVRSDRTFSGNVLTKHTVAVQERFSKVEQGQTDKVGRHPRLSWKGQAPTLRAGTGSDKGSFQSVRPIHPELNRVITVREAARLQGFPDRFDFHPTVWHSFRMIGNSVSPILAKAVLEAVRNCITQTEAMAQNSNLPNYSVAINDAVYAQDGSLL